MERIEKYLVSPYKITIFKDKSRRQFYQIEVSFDTKKYNSLCYAIEKQLLAEKGVLDTEVIKLEPLVNYLRKSVMNHLEKLHFESSKLKGFLCDWLVYRIIGLERLFPFLNDDKVQEIYLDKPGTSLYIDHQDYGRCLTNVVLNEKELESIKTRLCLEKDAIINYLNPSLKVELKTSTFHIRAAVDIPPLASDGMSMNIRKLRKKIWTLPELISCNMLSLQSAAYLIFVMRRRNNFTVIGEPGSGKTTLANSIDFLTPSYWRKITVEDVIESIEQTKYNKFQTRYSVSPFDTKVNKSSKSEEIIKLLHRSPNWVYLGEIQTAEHSKALFEALSAGLVGIQTCHGRSIEMMLIRWINQHGIPLTSILSLDILIETHSIFDEWKMKRNVHRIIEVSKESLSSNQFSNFLDKIQLKEIFALNQNNELEKKVDLFETPIVKKIRESKKITRDTFESELAQISAILEYLIKNLIFSPRNVLAYFNELESKLTNQIIKSETT
ncbi:MAG: ATPase, T2SS/T4P/T4SS family [Candidatus Heimdallarchaeota archaeon]